MRTLRIAAITVGGLATIAIGVVVDPASHSVSDTLYGAAVPVLLVWLAVAGVLLLPRRHPA